MVRRRKRRASVRRRRVALKRRRNPSRGRSWDTASQYRPARKKTTKKKTTRKSLRKRARATASVSKHRPTLYKTSKGWRRPKRSRYRIPGIRRMNPAFKLLSQRNLTMVAGYAAGTAAGFLIVPVVYQMLPARMQKRQWVGIGNVALGAVMFGYMKNKMAKNAGVMIAATGIYDLFTQQFPKLGLPLIPTTNVVTEQLKLGLPAPASAAADEEQQGVTYEAGGRKLLGLSYNGRASVPSTVGLTYEAPAMMGSSWETDSDNPYGGIFN